MNVYGLWFVVLLLQKLFQVSLLECNILYCWCGFILTSKGALGMEGQGQAAVFDAPGMGMGRKLDAVSVTL